MITGFINHKTILGGKMSNKLSSKLNWVCSEISHQLKDDEKECDCKDLDFSITFADWMMCPDCQRIWIRKFK